MAKRTRQPRIKQVTVREDRFIFDKVKQHLETLPEPKAKIEYLLEVKTEYDQTFSPETDWSFLSGPTFSEACGLEIQKLKELIALEDKAKPAAQGASEGGREKRGKGGTQFQNLLAIHYLLSLVGADSHNTVKAKFASFLTGYSENTFRQQWSNIHRKAEESGQLWERDMQAVRGYFEALSLHEVTKLIDNDLNSEREKL